MSESTTQRKKKPRSNKPKTSQPKASVKKRKTRTTRAYQQNEREVQALLEHTSLSIDISHSSRDVDDLSRSLDFFCRTSADDSSPTLDLAHRVELKKQRKAAADGALGEADSDDENENEEAGSAKTSSDDAKSSPGQTPSPSSAQQQQNTVSTYIQIDEDVLVPRVAAAKFRPNDDLLFKPLTRPAADVTLTDDDGAPRALSTNVVRMLNRYCEEAKARSTRVPKQIVKAVTRGAQRVCSYNEDTTLYRSFCEHQFHPIFCEPARDTLEIPNRKFLKIFFKELRFTEHPLLVDEHRFSNLLEDLCERHSQRLQAKICEKLRAELQTERKIVNELLKREASDAVDMVSPATQDRRTRTLEHHLLGVRALRNKLYEEEAESKRLLAEILDTWIRLKQLRKTQEFQYTRFKLRIQVEERRDVAAESRRWAERFETDLNEIYREELETYYRAKRLWKARDRDDGAGDSVKPRKPDVAKLSAELKRKLANSLTALDEPKIDIQLNRLSDEEYYNMPGRRRLKSFFMKIHFDDDFVSATRSYRMEPDLRLPINEIFGILLERRLPKEIRIALYEKSKLAAPRKVVDICVALPYPVDNEARRNLNVEFASPRPPTVKGRLAMRFQCDEQTSPSDMLHIPTSPVKAMCPKHTLDTWLAEQPFYQQAADDNKTTLEQEQRLTPGNEVAAADRCQAPTCTFEEELLQFCPSAELEHNTRFRLLRSRYRKNDARTRDFRFIAALENELEFDWEVPAESVIEAGNWMDPIDLYKHEGKKYLKSLYEAIRTQCVRLRAAAENVENLLIGDEPASWSTFFQTLALIFHPRRPLAAISSNAPAANAVSLGAESGQNLKIVLNVVRATGIPVRSTGDVGSESRRRSNDSPSMFLTQIYKYSNVRPFIALSYREKLVRSLTAEGSNPTWNEQLVLQLSGSLTDLRDDLKIILFDEVIESHVNDDLTVRNMDVYQRIQTNWLGEYRLPISALLAKQKFEGVCELHTPKVLLGYEPPSLERIGAEANVSVAIDQYPEIKETVRLWFYLSVEPSFEFPHINTSSLECSELKEVRRHLQEWCLQAGELKPQHFIEPLVCTADGKRVCLTRLLEPVPLPLEDTEHSLEIACRFVSLLSVLKCYDACAGFKGIWLNNQTLLEATWGSAKDLGVLLCNFLLTIGMPCWLVLGVAIPYGESGFVLYRSQDGELVLIDPSTGKQYGSKDVFCPLYEVSFVVSSDNVYCNIQSEARVSMMNFNFRDTSCWLPAFNRRNPAPLGGVQKLNYVFNESDNAIELRRNIERKIMKKVSTWRTMRKTIWNRAFQPRLHSILQDLEHLSTFGDAAYTETKYTDQLAAEFPTYKIYGFTLNFPYTNLASISDRIKSTGIHLNSDKNVEFSLAVHIDVYPNDVLSVWIFLASLIPSRKN